MKSEISRRKLLTTVAAGAGAVALGRFAGAADAQQKRAADRLPPFTGPGANPYWTSVGPVATYPQKVPLILLTDRPVQLETPQHYFLNAFTPNGAFYVRWHLDEIPDTVDLGEWRLEVTGNVAKPLKLSFSELLSRFSSTSLAAVNQCSGNSRSRLQPRVPGGQWGNGAMGNAMWTGVRLAEILQAAGVKPGSLQVQFQGMDRGKGRAGLGSNAFLKSLDLSNPVIEECLLAYQMNGEPLPLLNGFPLRVVAPGYFATYWMKALTTIRVLEKPDDNFWMKSGYRIPDTPRGTTTPAEVKAGTVKTIPIGRMPVRSFFAAPEADAKVPLGMSVTLRGIAFSGYGRVTSVAVSADDGRSWAPARMGQDYGRYSFRTWEFSWKPQRRGPHTLAVRATDEKDNVQTDEAVWNPGGYLWNRIERQQIMVGAAE
ncbi:MAG TPA: molybdopterin-dependent oxidoreductase [Candidatus Acidoferrales bacterium]|nr:molybdopterin-dependent oxidoreductase [Candidatus Acidoferrales bacterium]